MRAIRRFPNALLLTIVCALLIILAGAAVVPTLPIAQFPTLAPPQVSVTSVYVGASESRKDGMAAGY